MELLCLLPAGPHAAGKERILSQLATAVSFHHEDTGRHHYMKAGIIFLIKNTRPDDLRTGATNMECDAHLSCLLSRGSRLYIKVHVMLVTIHFLWQVPKECAKGGSFGDPKLKHRTDHGGGYCCRPNY